MISPIANVLLEADRPIAPMHY